MLMTSPITRLRSVKWLPSRRAKAQSISISLTAKSLRLRSVSVTKASEPGPPGRQDCAEIFRPSSGDLAGAVVSGAAISGAVATPAGASAGAVTSAGPSAIDWVGTVAGSTGAAFCAGPATTADAGADWSCASLGSGSMIQAANPATATTSKMTNFALSCTDDQ